MYLVSSDNNIIMQYTLAPEYMYTNTYNMCGIRCMHIILSGVYYQEYATLLLLCVFFNFNTEQQRPRPSYVSKEVLGRSKINHPL